MAPNDREPRFLTLADVAEILATTVSQVRALVRSGELRAIQIGGRGQYRVETVELEDYIQRMYAQMEAQSKTAPSTTDAGSARD
ncbi:helix-turn-helix domain-containing protein [Nocardioides mesophilus]|uniref:Helix-turn-helix domain-containing protein n=1 Tax=Nocardioides mesophilus TaxID=433659 RepID=A0A7G9RDD0_9ACTN|nr:helix-turn-helix domain-containing protein [Nocardioides mesophilus]QNN53605.1 helix-turn-helix domain-containing protein [Nocardioides mesophilus]